MAKKTNAVRLVELAKIPCREHFYEYDENDLSGLHAGADSISGDFSLQSSGYMIQGGKKTTYVKSFTVAGNFYDLLKTIRVMANNSKLPNAMGMTAFGAPSTLVDGLSVAGK